MGLSNIKSIWISLFSFGAISLPALAHEHRLASAAEIERVSSELQPGDTVILRDGFWRDQNIVFRGKGTQDAPITIRSETPGQVVLCGDSSVVLAGEHLVVSGIWLKEGSGTNDGITLTGRNCRLTQSAITGGAYKFFVHLFGTANRVDHCYFAGKTSDSPTLQIEVGMEPNNHRIDNNHFGPRPPLGRNGGETIRIGYSHQSMRNSRTVVEQNFFERCDGEIEVISNKSCENILRWNTFLECAGMLTLRHGNRCTVEGNFFFGNEKRGSGGIRIIGEDHTVINNYIEGVTEGGIWITSGIPNSELNGYFQSRNCLIAFNTMVGSQGPCIDLSAGLGTSQRTLRPEYITVVNNLFSVPEKGMLLKGQEGVGFSWHGNVADFAVGSPNEYIGIRALDIMLKRTSDGFWRPTDDSPVRGLAEGAFPSITTDIDGQPRTDRSDVGCDQISNGPITRRPLSSKDVGPFWMNRNGNSSD